MTVLFGRVCKVTLITPSPLPNAFFDSTPGPQNAIEIKDQKIEFEIERHVKSDPNKCEIKLYNLAEITRGLCEKKPLQVRLDAGYDGVFNMLFRGDVRRGFSELKKPEWITTLQLGDGDRAWRLGRINKTYAAGTPFLTAVKDCAKTMGIDVQDSDLSGVPGLRLAMVNARTAQGASRDELTRLLAPLGVSWSIQNGRLLVLSDDDHTEGKALVISQETGLVETPDYTTPKKEGKPAQLRFKMLLYPQLNPGRLVEVTSRAIKGKLFRIQRVVHRGDTFGDKWISEVEALPATAASANED